VKKKVVSEFVIPSGWVTVEQDLVRFVQSKGSQRSRHCQQNPAILMVPGRVIWTGTGQRIQVQEVTRRQTDMMVAAKDRIVVDADRVSQPLVVRAWQAGDRFCPLGMKGRSKKLQDFFMDAKLSLVDRRRTPLVVAPEGIVWVVGYRQDGRWAVTPDTKRYLALAVYPAQAGKGS
jgi:tRNA(Ile)-lysidine synthase